MENKSREEILQDNQAKRTKCMVYTRVMGYHRPVESFNTGKTGEHLERTKFVEPSQNIREFNRTHQPTQSAGATV